MRYHAHNAKVSFTFQTWDCIVVSACDSMSWAMGKHVAPVLGWLEGKYIKWRVAE